MAIAPIDTINIREIYPSDVSEIYQIELLTYDFPWSSSIFRDCIENKYDCYLALNGFRVVGYIIAKITPMESHILNLTIHDDYRRFGVASSFLDLIIDKAVLLKVILFF